MKGLVYVISLSLAINAQLTGNQKKQLSGTVPNQNTDDYKMERNKAKRLKKLIQAKTFQMRRYAQFEDMFRQEFNNHTLLLRFYAYGCYCLNLGDRPMAGIMTGMEPTDLLDESCFHWTKCNRCVVFDYGPMCSPEITAYNWNYDSNGEIQCLDKQVPPPADGAYDWDDGYGPGDVPGCRRAICECDKEQILALKHGELLTKVWNVQYHQFFGGFLFEYCKPKPKAKGTTEMNCCGKYPTRVPFNTNKRVCCDGIITSENRCVSSSFNKKRKRRSASLSELLKEEVTRNNKKLQEGLKF